MRDAAWFHEIDQKYAAASDDVNDRARALAQTLDNGHNPAQVAGELINYHHESQVDRDALLPMLCVALVELAKHYQQKRLPE